jgi:hypothetical protein
VNRPRRFIAAVMLGLLVMSALVVPVPRATSATTNGCPDVVHLRPAAKDYQDAPPTDRAQVPVVFVHGITTRPPEEDDKQEADHVLWNGRLRQQVEAFDATHPAVAVHTYAFDYRAQSSNWVTDHNIGVRLARGLECLANTYRRGVIVIAHSTGGLAAKYAVSRPLCSDGTVEDPETPTCPGAADHVVGDHVTEVITIATPYKGSALLAGAQSSRALLGLPAATRAPVERVLSECASYRLLQAQGKVGGLPVDWQDQLCGLAAVLSQPAGRALALNSPALQPPPVGDLPPWPQNLKVHAVAGDIQVGRGVDALLWWWKAQWQATLGDFVVWPDSAAGGSADDRPTTVACDGSKQLNVLVSECFHLDLPNNPAVINAVVPEVTAAIGASLTGSGAGTSVQNIDWRNASYTLDCGGLTKPFTVQLHDGNATAQGKGNTGGDYDHYDVAVGKVAVGDLTGDGIPEAAVLLSCSPQPSNFFANRVQVFTAGPRLLSELPSPRSENSAFPPLYNSSEFAIQDREIVAGVTMWAIDDPHCCPSLQRTVTWRWNGREFIQNR